MSRKVDMTPKNSVYTSFKYRDYKIYKAIAEYIDNSTQSFLDNKDTLKKLRIDIDYSSDSIAITDNAMGMNIDELEKALELGDKPKFNSGRNQFGMGLKVASIWFTDTWKITTRKFGVDETNSITINLEDLVQGIFPSIISDNMTTHGTKIELMNLTNRRITGKSAKSLKDLLSVIYKHDLHTGDIEIFLNGEPITPNEYEFYEDDEYGKLEREVNFKFSFEGKEYGVEGFVGVRTKGSTSATNGGFSLMDNNRVIIPNWRVTELFGQSNTFAYQRLVGEFNLINFNVTSDKQNFDWDNGLDNEFIENLKLHTKDYQHAANNIRVRTTEDFTEKEKKLIIKDAKEAVIISDDQISNIKDKPRLTTTQSTDELNWDKPFKIGRTTYTAAIEVINDAEHEFISFESKKNGKVEIAFNRNHPFLKPKINDHAEMVNYSNLLATLVIAMIHIKSISGVDYEGRRMIDPDDAIDMFNVLLGGADE